MVSRLARRRNPRYTNKGATTSSRGPCTRILSSLSAFESVREPNPVHPPRLILVLVVLLLLVVVLLLLLIIILVVLVLVVLLFDFLVIVELIVIVLCACGRK